MNAFWLFVVLLFYEIHYGLSNMYHLLDSESAYCKSRRSYTDSFMTVMDYTILSTKPIEAEDAPLAFKICPNDGFVPNGRHIQEIHGVEYYFPRLKITKMGYGQKLFIINAKNTTALQKSMGSFLTSHAVKSEFSYYNTPIIITPKYRYLRFIWRPSGIKTAVNITMVNYVRFVDRNISIEQQREMCNSRQKFWCANDTNVCLTERVQFNGHDDCFNGGSDEDGIPPHYRPDVNGTVAEQPSGSWTSSLPWALLALIPIVLICALARICSQKRALDIDDDYEYKMSFDGSDREDDEEFGGADGVMVPGGYGRGGSYGMGAMGADRGSDSGRSRSHSQDDSKRKSWAAGSDKDTEKDYYQDYSGSYSTSYAYPSGPPMPASAAEYCMPDDDKLEPSSADEGSPRQPPGYGHVMGSPSKLASDSVADTAPPKPPPRMTDSGPKHVTNPVYGHNIYVISPDTTMVVTPSTAASTAAAARHPDVVEEEEDFPPPPPPIAEDYVAPGGPRGNNLVAVSAQVCEEQDSGAYTPLLPTQEQLHPPSSATGLREPSPTTMNALLAAPAIKEEEADEDGQVVYAELLVPPQTSRPQPNTAAKIGNGTVVGRGVHMEMAPLHAKKPAPVSTAVAAAKPAPVKKSVTIVPPTSNSNGGYGGAKPKVFKQQQPPKSALSSGPAAARQKSNSSSDRSDSSYDKHYIVV